MFRLKISTEKRKCLKLLLYSKQSIQFGLKYQGSVVYHTPSVSTRQYLPTLWLNTRTSSNLTSCIQVTSRVWMPIPHDLVHWENSVKFHLTKHISGLEQFQLEPAGFVACGVLLCCVLLPDLDCGVSLWYQGRFMVLWVWCWCSMYVY